MNIVFLVTSLKPLTPFVQFYFWYKMQLMQPSHGETQYSRQLKTQYLSPVTQLSIPLPTSPMLQVWQIGAQMVQQQDPHCK